MKLEKNIIVKISIVVLFVTLLGVIYLLNNDKKSIEKDFELEKVNLSKNINTLDSEKKSLQNEIDSLNKKIEDLEKEDIKEINDCEFIQTFKVVDILKYDVDENSTFIVLDQFQMFSPFILRIPNKYISTIKVNKYYKFYFTGKTSYSNNLGEYVIKNIIESQEVGFDQIQEVCE